MNQDSQENKPQQEPSQTSSDPFDTSDIQPGAKQKKRAFLLIGLLLVTIAAGAYVLLSGNDKTESPADPVVSQQPANQTVELAAAISLTEGSVQYSSDGEAWSDAEGGETIQAGQYVRTLEDARAVVLLDDGSAVRLDSNSQIMLSVSDSSQVEVMLIAGQAYSRVVESESRSFAVITEKERFEAQGTAYKTSTGEKDEVEVYQSKVKVDSDGTEVEEGNKYDTDSKETSDIDLTSLSEDEFIQWNKEQDGSSDEFKDKLGVLAKDTSNDNSDGSSTPSSNSAAGASIVLEADGDDKGIQLEWSLNGASAPDGFKIVRDKLSSAPTYGEHKSVYISNGEQRSYLLKLTDGKSYNFRVCIYRAASSSCDTYSNVEVATAPFDEVDEVEDGIVELDIEGSSIEWEFTGTAPHGFKVVMSGDVEAPTYPANSIQYVSGTSTTLPEKPDGTYYVRVCKYTASSEIDGGCTDYSNTVEYVVD